MTERRMIRRLLALCLCLLLLPGMAGAAGEGALKYRLRFEMDPAAFPAEQQKTAGAAAALLNILGLSGKAVWNPEKNGSFRVTASAILAEDEATRNSFVFWGHEKHWGIRSSLLGEEKVMINLLALTEFALKTYFHMEIPLQRAALALPYASRLGWQRTRSAFRRAFKGEESRTYTKAECLEGLAAVSEKANSDSYFRLWATAVGVETGYDSVIRSAAADLPAWADSVLAEDGMRVTVHEDGRETWQTGDLVLYDGEADHFTCTIPQGDGPFAIEVTWRDDTIAGLRSLEGTLRVDADGEALYRGSVRADALPTGWDTDSEFSFAVDSEGDMTPADLHERVTGTLKDGELTVVWPDGASGRPRLTVSGTLSAYEPEKWPKYNSKKDYGFNLLSINDNSLPAFMASVRGPLLRGLMPILLRTPPETMTAAMDWLEDGGLFGLLTSGSAEEAEGFSASDVLPVWDDALGEDEIGEDETGEYGESEYEDAEGADSEYEYEGGDEVASEPE